MVALGPLGPLFHLPIARVRLAFAALILAFGGTAANAAPNWSQACTANNNFGLSHGECTSVLNGYYNEGKGNNDVAAYCKFIKAQYPAFFDANFKNVGDCIAKLKAYFPG